MRPTTPRPRAASARHLAVRVRLSAVAGIIAVLSVAGTGVAWAAWTAADSVTTTAAAATVGVSRSMSGSGLNVTYSSSTTAGAAAVTITNTSSREGTYALGVTASSSSSTMRAAVTVQIGTAASCTTTATLASPVSGTLATTTTATGPLAAGASLTLCVRTSMTASGISANGSASLAGSISSGIQVGTWSASATALTFTQSVAASSFASNEATRYQIFNQNRCVASDWGFTAISRTGGSSCPDQQISQWRLVDGPGGSKYIKRAHNAGGNPAHKLVAASASSVSFTTAADAANQQWLLTPRSGGTFRIQSVAQANRCLQVESNSSIILATCNDTLASQGFTFTAIGSPVPASPHPIVCAVSNPGSTSSYLNLNWPYSAEYQQEQSFRLQVDGKIVMPTYLDNWNAITHVHPAHLQAAGVPYGSNLAVTIEQSIAGSPWAVVATRTITYTSPGVVGCSA